MDREKEIRNELGELVRKREARELREKCAETKASYDRCKDHEYIKRISFNGWLEFRRIKDLVHEPNERGGRNVCKDIEKVILMFRSDEGDQGHTTGNHMDVKCYYEHNKTFRQSHMAFIQEKDFPCSKKEFIAASEFAQTTLSVFKNYFKPLENK